MFYWESVMQKDVELETIIKEIEAWRLTRKRPNSKIPVHFFEPIKNLALHHKKNFIAKTLGLSFNAINKILTMGDEKINFVEVLAEPILGSASTVSCAIQRPDGIKLVIETQGQHIANLMQAFICCK